MTRTFYFFSTTIIFLFFLFPFQSHATTQTFSSPGTYNLSLSGVNQITVSGSGGGGGGAGGAYDTNDSSPGDGGGGGAAAVSNSVINIPNGNVTLTIVVGGGGQGGPADWNSGSWQSGSSGGTTYLYVNGNQSLTLPGGNSPVMWAGGDYLNAGGSVGGSGGEAGGWGYRDCGGSGGKGGNSIFGTGGAATYGVAVSGNNGTGYGSGGSGASGGCNGNGGGPGGYGATGFMTITYTPAPPPSPPPSPTASLTASPTAVSYNGRSTLTWSSTNATNCIAGGPWSNSGTLFGSGLTDPLTSGTTFTLRCTGPEGTSALQSVTVTVAPQVCSNGANNPPTCSTYDPCANGANNPPSCSTFAPTASFSASPSTIDQGQSSTLTWSSTNATSCTGTGFTASGSSGSVSTGALNTPGTSNYQVVCSGTGGTSAPAFASVEVLSPTVTISATPARVQTGTNSQISWSASQVNSCTVSGPSLSSTNLSGSQSVPISAQSIYTITCQTNGSPVTKSVTVNVVAMFQEF